MKIARDELIRVTFTVDNIVGPDYDDLVKHYYIPQGNDEDMGAPNKFTLTEDNLRVYSYKSRRIHAPSMAGFIERLYNIVRTLNLIKS